MDSFSAPNFLGWMCCCGGRCCLVSVPELMEKTWKVMWGACCYWLATDKTPTTCTSAYPGEGQSEKLPGDENGWCVGGVWVNF